MRNIFKITILVEDKAKDERLVSEAGFSAFLEDKDAGICILFDTGENGGFLHNAQILSIDLRKTTHVVISHGHIDHTGGLEYWLDRPELINAEPGINNAPEGKKRLMMHPGALKTKRIKRDGSEYEKLNDLSGLDLDKHFDLYTAKAPFYITPDICFLGEIPRKCDFEGKTTLGEVLRDGQWYPDSIEEDSAIAIRTAEGLVILTGCSHSGICNIITYAKKIMNEERVADIIGGLHLKRSSVEDIEKTAAFLKKETAGVVHACHCTGENAVEILGKTLDAGHANTGQVFKFDAVKGEC